eukprot:1177940-Prorocentrum_minimum.AAC.1
MGAQQPPPAPESGSLRHAGRCALSEAPPAAASAAHPRRPLRTPSPPPPSPFRPPLRCQIRSSAAAVRVARRPAKRTR